MNRTERLYALVEELRAVSPRPRSATWLARRFEVSVRTIERDLDGLREAGVPLWSEPGRSGGYALDREQTLPPLALTAVEALAVSIALRSVARSPFAAEARSASLKILGALPDRVRRREQALAAAVHVVGAPPEEPGHGVVWTSVSEGRTLRLRYARRDGEASEREVEPLALLWGEPSWYLLGWCRLRDAVRGFRIDRIVAAELLDEIAPTRDGAVLDRELARIDARAWAAM